MKHGKHCHRKDSVENHNKKVSTATEEAVLTEIIETCEESIKEAKSGTGKGVPKPLKSKSKKKRSNRGDQRPSCGKDKYKRNK